MRVPSPSGGVPASAVAIVRLFRVGGSRITALLLNVTTPIGVRGFLAGERPRGGHRILDRRAFHAVRCVDHEHVAEPADRRAGRHDRDAVDGSPFSVTFTCAAVSACLFGRVRT